MPLGKVKFYNVDKGWGFIVPRDGGPDLFVHAIGLACPSPREGDEVMFDIETDQRTGRPRARNVRQVHGAF